MYPKRRKKPKTTRRCVDYVLRVFVVGPNFDAKTCSDQDDGGRAVWDILLFDPKGKEWEKEKEGKIGYMYISFGGFGFKPSSPLSTQPD